MTSEQLKAFIRFDALQTGVFVILEKQAFIQGVCQGSNLIREIFGNKTSKNP